MRTTINFWLLVVFFALLLGGASLGVLYMTRANSIVKAKISENKEAARPANLDAIVIQDKNCKDCFDAASFLVNFEKKNVKLISTRTIDRTDEETKRLITEYKIEKLPTIILRGEVQKNNDLKKMLLQVGDISGDTFVLRQVGGPYVIAATGDIKGRTELTLITDVSCSACYDVTKHQVILSRFGLNPQTKIIQVSSPEAQSLINKYKILFVPTFVLTGDVKAYPSLLQIWPQVGSEKNNTYIFDKGVSSMGVYRDLKTKKIINPAEKAQQNPASPKK